MTEASPSLPPSQRDVDKSNDDDTEDLMNTNDPLSETYNNPFDSQNSDPETQANENIQQQRENEDTHLRQLHREMNESQNLPNTQTEVRTNVQPDTASIVHNEQLLLAPSTSRRAPPIQTSRAENQVPLPFVFNATTQRQQRALIVDAIRFTENLVYNSTNSLPFETEVNSIYSIPLIREHHDAYLFFINSKTCEANYSDNSFNVNFPPVPNVNTKTFSKTINPQDIFTPIQDVFCHFLDKLQEANEFLENPVFLPSAFDELRSKDNFFETSDVDRIRQSHNPHHWLLRDLIQINNFQYKFFSELVLLDNSTIPQIQIYSLFLRKFFRFNYQLIWNQIDQKAFQNFPQYFSKEELLPFLISEENKHPRFVNLTIIDSDIIFQLNFLSSALTHVTTPIRPIGHNIDVQTGKTVINQNEPKSVSVTAQKVTTTQTDLLNTNLPENRNLPDSFTASTSYPFQVTTRTINTRNDTQDGFSINNPSSIRSNNNSISFSQNQPQLPATNPLVRFNNIQRISSNTNNSQNNQNQANISNTSNVPSQFHLNTITTGSNRIMSNPFLSRPPLNTLNAGDSYSLTSTNPNNFQTNTALNATNMNPQTLYQPHTTPLQQMNQPSYSALQAIPNNSAGQNTTFPVITTQNYTVPFVAMNKSVKPFDGLDHQYTPEEYLQQIDAHIIFTMGEQPIDPVAYNQWHKRKMAYIQCSLSGIALSWFLRLHESYKNDWSAFVSAFKKQFSSQKTAYYAQVEAQALTKKDTESVRHYALKVQQLVEKGWYNESAATINLKCNENIYTRFTKETERFCP